MDRRRLLREALDLWRGQPLAGLAGGWVERVRRGWHERRLDAVVGWAHAEVAAGDPATVIGPVTELLAQDARGPRLADAYLRQQLPRGRPAGR